MYRCLQLAKLGAGSVAPNPMVGAVLVYNNIIIGEGYHQHYGEAHAEVNCINSVLNENKKWIEKSTLYISLEPCVHFGKTPPCVDLIIKNKILKVVIACIDFYKEVNRKGIEKLKTAGVEVKIGVLENEAQELNKRFFCFHKNQRPYIILKWAQTKDNKIANLTNDRLLISNQITNRLAHQWRSQETAIMIGANTALKDNPFLTARLSNGKNPTRIVIDINLKLPTSLHIFNGDADTIVFNKIKHQQKNNILYYQINESKEVIKQVVEVLYKLKIQSIIIEGGAKLLQSFINENLWDQARIITNNQLIVDKGLSAPIIKKNTLINKEFLGNDTVEYFLNNQEL